MTEDDLLEMWTLLPADRARHLGFRIEPCDCEYSWCRGYQLAWDRPAWLGEDRREPERTEAAS